MDPYADAMTARGPTLGPDRETWTGSMHVVRLPDDDAARAFVEHEPYQRAGLYAEHAIWRFTDLLGRTMWEFAGAADQPLFLVLAPAHSTVIPDLDRVAVHGELETLDGEPAGVVLALQAPSRADLDALLREMGIDDAEVHDWEFGGRR